ncbi:dihydrolipoyl dehydrogenase [Caenimonas koreensis DSM 17982]|uniref:Dihydrolipoyl dehydrogenase n=1 Tax=Caenimonas koreensis DSM 17982 TaxID=1121255 RepID=A0A844AQR2_9BURK|nr:dihydrolipoyl dehydrogenase [Caenimonas koreensis]MRD46525.1 dihydrolipoyl dehydrogenase [Caenimonas koreensis DSM 17982]
MKMLHTTLLVIGGGPGGYVAAIRAGQLGVNTMLVEAESLGGTCLNIGCIPSKALIHAADEFAKARHWSGASSAMGISVQSPSIDLATTVKWKDGIVGKLTGGVGALLRKNGVKVVKGWATILDGKTVEVTTADGEPARIQCEHLLLATGSVPVELPFMPFGGAVISSTEALAPPSLPKRLVVVGGGYIGLELGMAYRKLGSEVAVVEATERILPSYDEALTKPVLASLKKLGVVLHLGCSVQGLDEGGGVRVRSAHADEFALPADRVLVAVGRKPRTDGFGLESLQLDMAGRAIKIDNQCRTSMRNVWAIGDVAGEPMLAHRAMAQGEMVAEIVSGKNRRFEPAAIPAVCFTDPEVVVVGMTPDDAKKAGLDCIESSFPLSANGRAMTLEATDGFIRVVARRDNHLIMGWQAVGSGVSELTTAFSQSIEMGARLEDVGGTIHAHPTLGEAVQEAALRALGHALHI